MSVWCCSDIHGNMDIWNKIKESLNWKYDILICLGDCADRGSDGWEIIKDMLRIENSDYSTYIRGNHEQMLINALDDYIKYDGMTDYNFYLLAQNGGAETFYDAIADPNMQDWLTRLKRTPIYFEYINNQSDRIFLSHAGCSWNRLNHHFKDGQFYKETLEMQEYLKKELLWNRKNFTENYKNNNFYDIQVYGHTPIPYLLSSMDYFLERPHSLKTSYDNCQNWHKINIDAGTYATNISILLNLDTFEEIIIKSE